MKIVDVGDLRDYCLAKPGAVPDFPFGGDTLVFKVKGKMFALCGIGGDPLEVNLKCEPELAELLRGKYPAVTPGYHMNKRHWNTVRIDGSIPDEVVLELIDLSYRLVVKGLKKADREGLESPG
jgi:predicted DNA-binding protein (MmcQ/YjbR family)